MRFNEWYPNGPMVAPGAISITKVKNALKKQGVYYVSKGGNIRVNGQLRGASGFIHSRIGNGVGHDGREKVVYFDTELSCQRQGACNILIRLAKDDSDYCGETNNYTTWEDFAKNVDRLFGQVRPMRNF